MADLLDRIQREISERLEASRSAMEEYERLEAALAALEPRDEESSASRPKRRRAPKAARSALRAPRGANREAVLGVVAERPGVSAGEIAAASGVAGGTVYGVLSQLAKDGLVEKEALPGDKTGYRTCDPSRASESGDAADGDSADPVVAPETAADAPDETISGDAA